MTAKWKTPLKKLQESNRELKSKLEHLERYSRDFNIRLIGVEEEEGEDCMATFSDHFTLLGFEEARGELENAHRRATLKAGMTERRNDGIAESRNGGKYPQILKDGMTENHPNS